MSELIKIQKIEYITLEQFIPNWTEMIEEMDVMCVVDKRDLFFHKLETKNYHRIKYAKGHGFDYMNPQVCLVGEAHHNNNYWCRECGHLCGFADAGNALCSGKEVFKEFKVKLFTHMLEAHSELMIKHD